MIDIHKLTIKDAREALSSKKFTAKELAQAYLDNISKVNKDINAYLEVYDDVLKQADAADEKISKGETSPLLGIPMGIKDNILIKGKRATSGSNLPWVVLQKILLMV
ncbi:MAG: aspartyl/glutamyl-tRNA(Asn/Gln) amidotransferase subunit A [Parcubacteria bacterium C7867-003]|nr:MAG: aspartyl/glutamyl-tRNA(Asn/Gln) amidotransferase subunit A [Parcubacteria bacterium C7867-003]